MLGADGRRGDLCHFVFRELASRTKLSRMASAAPYGKSRDEILKCAVKMIDEGSESDLRVHDITTETGCSTSSIYHYFKNRDGLIATAQVERCGRGLLRYDDIVMPMIREAETREEFHQAIVLLLESLFDSGSTQLRKSRATIVGTAVTRPQVAEKISKMIGNLNRRYAALLQPAQEKGWMRSDVDLVILAAWTSSLMFGRLLIEMGETGISDQGWNQLAAQSLLFLYFGGVSGQPVNS